MIFTKWVFRVAGIYGLLVLTPFYFMETDPRLVAPPPVTHPEYFYGFVGVGIAFQVVFLIISTDARKYRLLMLPSMIEKFSFVGANLVLFLHQRLAPQVIPGTVIDAVLGLLFVASYLKTREP